MLNSLRVHPLLHLLIAVAACGSAGCSSQSGEPIAGENADDVGSVGLQLRQTDGVLLDSLSYTISGPQTYTGTVNLAGSTTFSFLRGGIAAGTGYTVTISGTGIAGDAGATCAGASSPFAVTVGGTTTVAVTLECKLPHNNGSVIVGGTLNVCPTVLSTGAAAPVGNRIAVTSTARDLDNGPSALAYHWTTSSGSMVNPDVQNPIFQCTAPGLVSMTVTVSDGDAACSDGLTTSILCPDEATLGDAAWVELGPTGQILARLITPYTSCPVITVDGVTHPMNLRAAPSSVPLRPTQNDPVVNPASTTSKPSLFPVTACEYTVPAGTHTLSAGGKNLPLPKTDVQRVVILGDTGCRLAVGNAIQNCNDVTSWPFPLIAQAAAATNPDLVLHVGDYHYREIACPADTMGCAGSPWGYGYDVWAADFFTPAAPLLAAAPWVMVRGNHESCTRGGQGWFRFLDTLPYAANRSCDDAANDSVVAFHDPYAVRFGDTQFVVFDSSSAGKAALTPATKPADVVPFNSFQAELQNAGTFTADTSLLSIFTNHHPLLGFTAGSPVTGGNPALLSVMSATYPTAYYPPGVGLALHGHVHDFQAVNFASGHPSTIVAGIGGDNLDVALPDPFPTNVPAAVGTVLDKIAYSNTFGFLVMDRVGSKQWKFTVFRRDGSIMTVCDMLTTPFTGSGSPTPGRQISCTVNGNIP